MVEPGDLDVRSIYGAQWAGIARDRIIKAQAEKAPSLDLAGLGLLEIPQEIYQMTGLRYLALNRNQISSLSSAIENLTHLTDLNLSGNKLENLPPEIGRLPRLNRLFLSRNWISTLPIELAEAKYL